MTTILAGRVAPAFALPDMEGKTRLLVDALKKGPVVIAFFKVSCPVCQYTFPFLERIHRFFQSSGFTIWGISQDNSRDSREFMAASSATFSALMDDESFTVSNCYGLTNVPTVLLIGQNQRVRVSSVGFNREDLARISTDVGKMLDVRPDPLFRPEEHVPDFKPG